MISDDPGGAFRRNDAGMPALTGMQSTLPALQIRHSGTSGRERWTVRATWQDGTFEEIAGFANEAEADEWIAHKFPIWIDEIDKARKG
jgi:hypothetical protein